MKAIITQVMQWTGVYSPHSTLVVSKEYYDSTFNIADKHILNRESKQYSWVNCKENSGNICVIRNADIVSQSDNAIIIEARLKGDNGKVEWGLPLMLPKSEIKLISMEKV